MFHELDLLTQRAVARRLRVSVAWLQQEARDGRLPAVRAGDDYLFHFPTVLKILAERAASEGLRTSPVLSTPLTDSSEGEYGRD